MRMRENWVWYYGFGRVRGGIYIGSEHMSRWGKGTQR